MNFKVSYMNVKFVPWCNAQGKMQRYCLLAKYGLQDGSCEGHYYLYRGIFQMAEPFEG
jgi:hypothetical protein